MPELDRIEACVLVDGEPLTEYANPDAADTDLKAIRYVEAKVGQTFSVKVTLKSGFRFHFATDIYVAFHVDQGQVGHFYVQPYKGSKVRKGVLQQDYTTLFGSRHHKNSKTGQWTEYCFEFGSLALSEWQLSVRVTETNKCR
jgi:hypothetical protein